MEGTEPTPVAAPERPPTPSKRPSTPVKRSAKDDAPTTPTTPKVKPKSTPATPASRPKSPTSKPVSPKQAPAAPAAVAKTPTRRQKANDSPMSMTSPTGNLPKTPTQKPFDPRRGTLLRGMSFQDDYSAADRKIRRLEPPALAIAENGGEMPPSPDRGSSPITPKLVHNPTMITTNKKQLVPGPARSDKKYTVVLDLDETVVYARDGELYARAFTGELLRTMNKHCEVIVWTAGVRSYAKAVVEEINVEGIIQHLVYRNKSWFNPKDYTKDLRQLGRDIDYVLIIENTPDCIRENPEHGIIVSDYEGGREVDHTFMVLAALVEELGNSGKTVPEFLRESKTLQKQIITLDEKAGTTLPIYFLGKRKKVVKRNRDKEDKEDTAAPAPAPAPADDATAVKDGEGSKEKAEVEAPDATTTPAAVAEVAE